LKIVVPQLLRVRLPARRKSWRFGQRCQSLRQRGHRGQKGEVGPINAPQFLRAGHGVHQRLLGLRNIDQAVPLTGNFSHARANQNQQIGILNGPVQSGVCA
jgi:hypothetical protein